ncbi:MAG: VanZ family protein [Peptostreptococcaceae bacterium]
MQILGRDILISLIMITILVVIDTNRMNEKIISLYNLGIILFSMTVVIIFSLTGISPISGFNADIRIAEVAFIPFSGIGEMVQSGLTLHSFINIFGNILMFVPIGFLLPLLWDKFQDFKKTVLLGFGISLLIEFTQLFLVRATDIDDLILNTSGAILGYLVFISFKRLFPHFIEKHFVGLKITEDKLVLWICVLVPYVVIIIGGFYDRSIF